MGEVSVVAVTSTKRMSSTVPIVTLKASKNRYQNLVTNFLGANSGFVLLIGTKVRKSQEIAKKVLTSTEST